MIEVLVLPETLRNAIRGAARHAFPRECCGLIEGIRDGSVVRVATVHATHNLSEYDHRFEIDPADQIRLMKSLRGTGRDIVGCYHSHPNGQPLPSARDRDSAFGEDFVWVIAALADKRADATVTAFFLTTDGFRELDIVPVT